MSIMDERVSQLIAEIHDRPSPEEAFSKWMFVDIFILDGLMMLFTILFMIVRDIQLVAMVGFASVAFGAAYLYVKDNAKHGLVAGRDFLDSQTIIGDMEITEQIAVRAYDYVLLPKESMDGNKITYTRRDLDDSLGTLRTSTIRVGGESELRPEVVENLVRLRLRELKEIEDMRVAEDEEKEIASEGKRGRLDFLKRGKSSKVRELPKVLEGEGFQIGDVSSGIDTEFEDYSLDDEEQDFEVEEEEEEYIGDEDDAETEGKNGDEEFIV